MSDHQIIPPRTISRLVRAIVYAVTRWNIDAITPGPVSIFFITPTPTLEKHESWHRLMWSATRGKMRGPRAWTYVAATVVYLSRYIATWMRFGYRNHPEERAARKWAGEE